VPASEQTLWWSFVASIIAILVLLTGLVVATIVAQRQRATLRNQFASRLLHAHDDERARIARELHDDALQRLAVITLEIDQLTHAAIDLRGAPPPAALAGIRGEIQDLSDALRQLAHRLHPCGPEPLALDRALEQLAGEIRSTSNLAVDFTVNWNGDWAVPQVVRLALYRIAQEALLNVVKHARGRAVALRITRTPGGIELTVSDDGCGFVPDRLSNGLGLVAMAERVSLVGGFLTVDSRPGQGTVVRANVPLLQVENGATSPRPR
jgi:signal transduction histidine kinase